MIAGVVLSIVWLNQLGEAPVERAPAARPAVLVASHAIPAGTLLRPEDLTWSDVGAISAGNIVRGQISETEFVGAIARRGFAQGEALIAADLVKPNERQFLSAVLRPGTRAVSISVDAPQSTAGLVLPGDQVDVILTQSFGDSPDDPSRKTVAETVLRDTRIIAVDQTLSTAAKPAAPPRPAFGANPEARIPKTVTFEVTEREAERVILAVQLGRLQLAVRPLEVRASDEADSDRKRAPTWASDVSPALTELARKMPTSGSSVESAVRRPPTTFQ